MCQLSENIGSSYFVTTFRCIIFMGFKQNRLKHWHIYSSRRGRDGSKYHNVWCNEISVSIVLIPVGSFRRCIVTHHGTSHITHYTSHITHHSLLSRHHIIISSLVCPQPVCQHQACVGAANGQRRDHYGVRAIRDLLTVTRRCCAHLLASLPGPSRVPDIICNLTSSPWACVPTLPTWNCSKVIYFLADLNVSHPAVWGAQTRPDVIISKSSPLSLIIPGIVPSHDVTLSRCHVTNV